MATFLGHIHTNFKSTGSSPGSLSKAKTKTGLISMSFMNEAATERRLRT